MKAEDKIKIGSCASDRRPQRYETSDPYKLTPFAVEDEGVDSVSVGLIIFAIVMVIVAILAP